jgi:cytochrome c553
VRHVSAVSCASVASRERGRSNNGGITMIGNHLMIGNRLPTVSGVLVVLATLAVPANAADVHAHEVPAVATPGNVAEAEAILGAKLLICNTCHGADGVPRSAGAPIIWGQQENYLAKQMHDFQHGDRDSDVMYWMTTALSPAELERAASYFAKKNWPARPAAVTSPSTMSPPDGVAVCQACHQQNLAGGLAAPRLAGQRYEYLIDAMHHYAEGGRSNNTDMMRIMEAIPASDREAIARYIAGL